MPFFPFCPTPSNTSTSDFPLLRLTLDVVLGSSIAILDTLTDRLKHYSSTTFVLLTCCLIYDCLQISYPEHILSRAVPKVAPSISTHHPLYTHIFHFLHIYILHVPILPTQDPTYECMLSSYSVSYMSCL
jgi:hypothetical protein